MKAHSPEKRVQAVTAYLGLGNAELVGALVKVPPATIRKWKQEPWWADLENQIRDEENVRADKKLTAIVDKTMDLLADRVERGDFVWDSKNQQMVRRPLLARDAVRVVGELFDRREFLRKARQEKEVNIQNVEQTLLRVAEQFIKIAKARKGDTIDVTEYTEVTTNDQEGWKRLPSEIGVREESFEAGAVEGSGEEEAGSGGVLQTQEGEVDGEASEEFDLRWAEVPSSLSALPGGVRGEAGGDGVQDLGEPRAEPRGHEDDAASRSDSRASGRDGLEGEGAYGSEDGEAVLHPDPDQPSTH